MSLHRSYIINKGLPESQVRIKRFTIKNLRILVKNSPWRCPLYSNVTFNVIYHFKQVKIYLNITQKTSLVKT